MSYSAADRLRFIDWLKARYGTVEALNKAWATQRWSRRLGSFDEVQLPNGEGPSPPERYLDLRRFWSDQAIEALRDLEAIRRKNMPDLPSASNLWDTAPRMGFDYLRSYQDYASHGAMGFYPGLHWTRRCSPCWSRASCRRRSGSMSSSPRVATATGLRRAASACGRTRR